MRFSIFFVLVLFLSGCTIKQEITPVPLQALGDKKVCIQLEPNTKEGFLQAYKSELELNGYDVTVYKDSVEPQGCDVTSTYIAKWSWDMAIYMSYADIQVFKDKERVGRAYYDATGGSANMKKFVKGDAKVRELVRLLYKAEGSK